MSVWTAFIRPSYETAAAGDRSMWPPHQTKSLSSPQHKRRRHARKKRLDKASNSSRTKQQKIEKLIKAANASAWRHLIDLSIFHTSIRMQHTHTHTHREKSIQQLRKLYAVRNCIEGPPSIHPSIHGPRICFCVAVKQLSISISIPFDFDGIKETPVPRMEEHWEANDVLFDRKDE